MTNAKVNFGASKLTVHGEASIVDLEKAGSFDNIKIYHENEKIEEENVPFWRKRENQKVMVASLFLVLGWILSITIGEHSYYPLIGYATAIIIGGYALFIQGFKNLLRFNFDMTTLMTIAVIGAAIIGEWGEGATVVILFAISEALETYSMDKARGSIRALMDIAPSKAIIKRDGQEMEIPVEDIQIGDVMLVKPGQKLAMDGLVIKGASAVNEAAITGESVPVTKSIDDEVFAGTLNEEGLLEVKVTKRVEDTTIAKIVHLVEEAQAERAPSQAFVDKFAKYYTPAIILVALGIVFIPPLFFAGVWSEWVYRGLAVLVVGCPCALVISTPVAIVTAIGNAAKNGVLIKGGIYLEQLGSLSAIAFDKTGTLTRGVPEVTTINTFSNKTEEQLLSLTAAIEYGSQHPLASAILRKADKRGVEIDPDQVENFQSLTGKGVKATYQNKEYYIGNLKLFSELKLTFPEEIQQNMIDLQNAGNTVMIVGTVDEILGIFAVRDEVRETSKDVIKKLHDIGIKKTIMLTGDNERTASAIANELDLEVKAELLPEDKLNYIKKLREEYHSVSMIGDGVNDAPALAASTVGIAMGGAGTDTALETADVALMADDLKKLPYTIKLSRRALSVIKQNIIFSLGIKVIALLLIIPDWLTLWVAILADMGATLLVTLNGLRLLKVKDEE